MSVSNQMDAATRNETRPSHFHLIRTHASANFIAMDDPETTNVPQPAADGQRLPREEENDSMQALRPPGIFSRMVVILDFSCSAHTGRRRLATGQ